jgi:hypothetical protein
MIGPENEQMYATRMTHDVQKGNMSSPPNYHVLPQSSCSMYVFGLYTLSRSNIQKVVREGEKKKVLKKSKTFSI